MTSVENLKKNSQNILDLSLRSLSNGTVAIDIALKVLGIGKGDEVIVTSRTFIASVSSIVNAGASPVFTNMPEFSKFSFNSISKLINKNAKLFYVFI